jgi:ribonucleoside-diphosphate reductase alpha chain
VGRVNDKETIEKVVPVVMRALDNVITLNAHPLEETKVSSEKYRAV